MSLRAGWLLHNTVWHGFPAEGEGTGLTAGRTTVPKALALEAPELIYTTKVLIIKSPLDHKPSRTDSIPKA